jgi:hypothetical protein
MPINNDPIRDRLLGQLPQPADLAQHRERVSQMLEQNQKRIRRERVAVTAFWIFCAVSATAWMWFSADGAHLPKAPFLACIFFTWGGVEVVKHHINACRIDLLKEVKQLQLQTFELEQRLQPPPGSTSR